MARAKPWTPFASLLLTALVAAQGEIGREPEAGLRLVREGPKAAADARWTLWATYADEKGAYCDDAAWLRDLQARNADRGLRVVVAMPEDAARRLAEGDRGHGVAVLAVSREVLGVPEFELRQGADGAGTVLRGIDVCLDVVEAALDGGPERAAPGEADVNLDSVLAVVGDGGDYDDLVAHCVKCLPHSGRARGLAVLHPWWCKGDYEAARRAFFEGLAAVDGYWPSLVSFADLVLRGDSVDPAIPRALLVALAPAAAAAPDGARTQLVYLRALLRCGQDRAAARVIERLPALVEDDPILRVWLAETLMEATDPKPWRALATSLVPPESAFDRFQQDAQDAPYYRRLRTAALHKVLSRCDADAKELADLLRAHRGDGDGWAGLNNEAWYTVSGTDTMGRFPTFALALADEMAKVEGDDLEAGSKDTVALVAFCNGQWQRAIDLQREAVASVGGDSRYAARLRRFEEARAITAARSQKKAGTGR